MSLQDQRPPVAFNIGEKSDDPISMYLNGLYTSGVNLAGLQVGSIPSGFVMDLLVLQFIGNYLDETLLYLSHQYQLNSDGILKLPLVFKTINYK